MTQADDLAAIVAASRQTRARTPRWLWLAAAAVGVICAAGFAMVLLAPAAPSRPARPIPPCETRPTTGAGFGAGAAVGGAAGLVLGLAIARQRRGHSSRRSP